MSSHWPDMAAAQMSASYWRATKERKRAHVASPTLEEGLGLGAGLGVGVGSGLGSGLGLG